MLLITGFVVLVILVGFALDVVLGLGFIALFVALVFAAAMAFGSWYKSDSIALSMSRARPADPEQYARLHNIVDGLCIAAGLPKPRLYIVDDPAPNAFATGRNPKNAAIAVTTGLLEKMNRIELEGVIAHELSHIKNYDILVSTIAVTLVGTVILVTDIGLRAMWWGNVAGGRGRSRSSSSGGNGLVQVIVLLIALALLVLAPLFAKIMQAAVGRRRESLADASAVHLTRYPPGLISALEKIRDDHLVVSGSRATAHMWIESPLARTKSEGSFAWLNRLFETHPPIEHRIAALREM